MTHDKRGSMKDINTSCTIIGSNTKNLPWQYDEESKLCKKFKKTLMIRILLLIENGYDTFYTGMYNRIDMMFAETIIDLKETYFNTIENSQGIKLIGVLAFAEQDMLWHTAYQQRYRSLLNKCDEVIELNEKYHKDCYRQRNEYLVNHSERLIAVCDYRRIEDDLYNTIDMAKKLGCSITTINPFTLKAETLKYYPKLI